MGNSTASKIYGGLTQTEAMARLRLEGHHELPAVKPRNLRAITIDVEREPMFILLIVGGIVYLVLGDMTEAVVLLLSILIIIAITTYQERKTERAVEALRDLAISALCPGLQYRRRKRNRSHTGDGVRHSRIASRAVGGIPGAGCVAVASCSRVGSSGGRSGGGGSAAGLRTAVRCRAADRSSPLRPRREPR